MSMNLLFESPSRKRDFLNEILSSSFDGYGPVHSHYQKILKNRNAILKNISKWRGQEKELDYWDTEFCNACVEVYRYRYLLVEFFKKNMSSLYAYFSQNDILISFNYINKCGFKNVWEYLLDYLRSNRERDIILQRTSIWAHLDDFEININTQSVESYCSRWEIKSIIIGLKMLECKFIEEHCDNHIILLIDDLESELDQKRLAQLLSSFWEYQTFLTNISPLKKSEIQQIKLV
jgi:DNA replication and repair protein RecF